MSRADGKTVLTETGISKLFPFDTDLAGRWLRVARVIWIVLALAVVLLNVLAIPGVFTSLTSPDFVQELHGQYPPPAIGVALIMGINGLCTVLYLAISVLLFWQRAANRMAFYCSLMLLTFGGAVFGFLEYVPSTNLIWNLATFSLFFIGQVSFLSFFYLFPSGQFVPRWTVWIVLLYAAYWVVWLGSQGFTSGPPGNLFQLFLLTGVIAQIYRYRAVSTRHERQQTKWVVFGFVMAILLFIGTRLMLSLLPPDLQNSQAINSLVGGGSVFLSFMLIPVFIGIAILRAQLFDIDLIISRALVYTTLTSCIVGFYVLVVGYLGTLFRTGNNLLISLAATGLVAVLFQPLRERLQSGVNRLLYGQRDEPYTVITRLSERLKETLVPEAVLLTIVETVAQALKLPYAAILWKQDDEFELAASYGSPTVELLTLSLVYQTEIIGQLQLAPRGPGEAFTPADLRLLDELTRQAGLAAHAVRLTTDLQQARERLALAREEERRRLRRDLHDGVGPTLASLSQRIDTACHLIGHDPDAAIALLDNLKAQVKSTIADIRRVVYALRPPVLDELGLISAIREHAIQFQSTNGFHVTVEVPAVMPPLPAAVEVAAYRIVVEALTNVARHAQAQHCVVRLQLVNDRTLCLEVVDDGCGLPAAYHAGVGITSIRERTAELDGKYSITSQPDRGTRVQVQLPLKS